jgi:hypothetical protein
MPGSGGRIRHRGIRLSRGNTSVSQSARRRSAKSAASQKMAMEMTLAVSPDRPLEGFKWGECRISYQTVRARLRGPERFSKEVPAGVPRAADDHGELAYQRSIR